MIEIEHITEAFSGGEYLAEWRSPSKDNWLTDKSHYVIEEDGFAFRGCLSVSDADQFSPGTEVDFDNFPRCLECQRMAQKYPSKCKH